MKKINKSVLAFVVCCCSATGENGVQQYTRYLRYSRFHHWNWISFISQVSTSRGLMKALLLKICESNQIWHVDQCVYFWYIITLEWSNSLHGRQKTVKQACLLKEICTVKKSVDIICDLPKPLNLYYCFLLTQVSGWQLAQHYTNVRWLQQERKTTQRHPHEQPLGTV